MQRDDHLPYQKPRCDRIFALRDQAKHDDMRNRAIEPDAAWVVDHLANLLRWAVPDQRIGPRWGSCARAHDQRHHPLPGDRQRCAICEVYFVDV
jgi:hypothetical protein